MSTAPDPPPTSNRRPWLPLAALALLTLAALALRLWQIGESLWVDELHTSWVVIDGLGPIPHRAAMGNYSPAYFYLVWAVTQLAGHTEFALRLPSLAAGVALVPVLYCFVRRATGLPAAGLLAAALATLDPNGLYYSLEARPYAFVELLGVVQVWLFWRLIRGPSNPEDAANPEDSAPAVRRRLALRAAFVVASLALFYLHYTTQLLLAAEVLAYGLLTVRADRLFTWLRLAAPPRYEPTGLFARLDYKPLLFLLDLAVILAGQLVMLPGLLAIYHRRDNWEAFVRPQPWWAIFTLFPLVIYLLTPLLAFAAGYGIYLLGRLLRPKAAEIPTTIPPLASPAAAGLLLLALCWFFVPVAVAWGATQADLAAVFLRRYLMASAAAPLVLAGLIYAATPSRLARATVWVFALAFLLGGDGVITTGVARQFAYDGRVVDHSNEDWRGAVAWLNEQMKSREGTVVAYAGLIEQFNIKPHQATPADLEYFNYPVSGIYRLEAPLATPDDSPSQAAFGIVRGDATELVRRYWVGCHLPPVIFDLPVPYWPPPEGHLQRFHGVTIVTAEEMPPSAPSP